VAHLSGYQYFESVVSGRNVTVSALLLRSFLTGLSFPYSLFMRGRNALYNKGLLRPRSAGVPVISVGNITLGGTGKTPFVEWVCRYLLQKGRSPVVLSRGYGRGGEDSNDEFKVLAANLPGLQQISHPDRVGSARKAVSDLCADCIVLDDGFSHRRLKRNLDILLLDIFKPFGYGRVFPGGLLREPIEAAERADILVITRTELVEAEYLADFEDKLKRFFPDKPIVTAVHRPVKVRDIFSGKEYPPDWIAGKNVYAFCGIGNPAAFGKTIESRGAVLQELRAYGDHYIYKREDLSQVLSGAGKRGSEIILTTQKDGVKIRTLESDVPIYELIIRSEVVNGLSGLQERIEGALCRGNS